MKIGIALPHMGQETTPALITRMAQEAERLDYASLWVGERLLRTIATFPMAAIHQVRCLPTSKVSMIHLRH